MQWGKQLQANIESFDQMGKSAGFRIEGTPTVDQKGDFVDFNSVLFDITDRKESEGLYQSLVEMSPDIISVVNNGKIEYINEAGCKVIGAKKEEVIGQSVKDFVPVQITDSIKSKVFSADKLENERFMFSILG